MTVKEETAAEFEAAYAARSGVTVEWLHSEGFYAEPCDCGEEICEGWAMRLPVGKRDCGELPASTKDSVMTTVLMIDTIHASTAHIPPATPKVAGYVSGTALIKWTDADWALFPKAGHVRIEQGYGAFDPLNCDAFDVEELRGGGWTITPSEAAHGVRTRLDHGAGHTTVYATPANLSAVAGALNALAVGTWWHGHVRAWVADWDLDEAGAAGLVGTSMHGMPVVAVQWASPSSNPHTVVPGGTMTLQQANVDLSVTAEWWHAPPKPTPAPVLKFGYVTPTEPLGTPFAVTRRPVTAADVGKPAWF